MHELMDTFERLTNFQTGANKILVFFRNPKCLVVWLFSAENLEGSLHNLLNCQSWFFCSFHNMIKCEKTSTNNNFVTNAAASAAFFHYMASKSSLAAISTTAETAENLEKGKRWSKRNGLRTRNGPMPSVTEHVWFKVDKTEIIKNFLFQIID